MKTQRASADHRTLELQKRLGERVRDLRLRAGFGQEPFADHCNLHRVYVSDLERSQKNATLDALSKVATGLKMTISELFEGLGPGPSRRNP
ncbi:MAG: helix-turn-helix transcriptional regulator [Verrucomicrobia bacterium]|nr:helix-turn-helix transcriptional regulator [Verrucomicrobiota bacterium]